MRGTTESTKEVLSYDVTLYAEASHRPGSEWGELRVWSIGLAAVPTHPGSVYAQPDTAASSEGALQEEIDEWLMAGADVLARLDEFVEAFPEADEEG